MMDSQQQQQQQNHSNSKYYAALLVEQQKNAQLMEMKKMQDDRVLELKQENELLKQRLYHALEEHKNDLQQKMSTVMEHSRRSTQDHIVTLRATLAASMVQHQQTIDQLMQQSQALIPDRVRQRLPPRKTQHEILQLVRNIERQHNMPPAPEHSAERLLRIESVTTREETQRQQQIDQVLKSELRSFANTNEEARAKLNTLNVHIERYQREIAQASHTITPLATGTIDPGVLELQERLDVSRDTLQTLIRERDLVQAALNGK